MLIKVLAGKERENDVYTMVTLIKKEGGGGKGERRKRRLGVGGATAMKLSLPKHFL